METSDANKPVVRLDGVEARIGGTRVLSDITWHLASGEHWGIVGPNGSGKSTLLALVSGQQWPAPGAGRRSYTFDGRTHTDAVEARKRITCVGPELQDRYVRMGWNFSALEVVLTGIFRSEIPRRAAREAERRRASSLLASAGLAALGDRPFLELSRGEQRRVLIARGIAFDAAILLLDEPASGLDPAARAALEETITRASRHAQIIAAAHAADDLPAIVTRYVELREGRIVRRGTRGRAAAAAAGPQLALDNGENAAPPLAAPLVTVRNANVWLGTQHVLRDIDWSLLAGQHWLICGPNGAGKSTLLRLLHGQLRPALGGRVAWPGLGDPRNVWRLRKRIGWVAPELQAAYRFPTTAYECVASGFRSSIGLTHRLTAEERTRTEELLAGFELEHLHARRLDSLSYGQLRRLLIARTLAMQPRLLLLDEPWEGLDKESVDIVRRELRHAAAAGTQIVCVSHIGDMGLGFTHELELEDGRIVRSIERGLTNGDADAAPRGSSANARARAQGCPPH